MVNKSVQILFTEEEFHHFEEEAAKKGLTVPLYIKSMVLKNDKFTLSFEELLNKADQLSSGTKFTIKALFGTEWSMPKGIKLTLGKTYYNRVSDGTISNVKPLGKDSSNIMWYEKL